MFCSLEAGSVGPRRLDISYPTTEFTKLVKMWEKFDESTMGIVVRHIKKFVCLDFFLEFFSNIFLTARVYPTTSSMLASAPLSLFKNV